MNLGEFREACAKIASGLAEDQDWNEARNYLKAHPEAVKDLAMETVIEKLLYRVHGREIEHKIDAPKGYFFGSVIGRELRHLVKAEVYERTALCGVRVHGDGMVDAVLEGAKLCPKCMRAAKTKPSDKPYSVWLVEDDDPKDYFLNELRSLGVAVERFASMFEANESGKSAPDCLILDVAAISTIMPGLGTSLENLVGPLRQFLDNHPGVLVGVYSMVGAYARDVVEEIRQHHPDVAIHWLELPHDLNIYRAAKEFISKYRP